MGPGRFGSTVAALRASGYRVQVRHERLWEQSFGSLGVAHFRGTRQEALARGLSTANLSTRGGSTVVRLMPPDGGSVVEGVAICRPDLDTYNRKLGRTIALGRAMVAAGLLPGSHFRPESPK